MQHLLFVETAANRTMKEDRPPLLIRLTALSRTETSSTWLNTLVAIKDSESVSPYATALHGITDHYAIDNPLHIVSPSEAIAQFVKLSADADTIIGHSVDYHTRLLIRTARLIDTTLILPAEAYCTMRRSTAVLRLPNPRGHGLKFPKLSEAYKFFAETELILPEDPLLAGLTQVTAIQVIYDGLQKLEQS